MDELFLKALTEYYNSDRLAPGIVVAWLPEKQTFYASVTRFPSIGHHHKEVVVKVEDAESAAVALDKLAEKWKSKVAPRKTNLAAFLESGNTIHVLKENNGSSNCDGV
jgi:hypothetical protein